MDRSTHSLSHERRDERAIALLRGATRPLLAECERMSVGQGRARAGNLRAPRLGVRQTLAVPGSRRIVGVGASLLGPPRS
jgi:hypothetical protein